MNDEVKNWVMNNKDFLKEKLGPFVEEYNKTLSSEDSAFFDDINTEFERQVKELIAIEIGKSLALSPLDVVESLEEVNISWILN